MKRISLILLCIFLMSGCATPFHYAVKEENQSIKMIVATDLHYIDPSLKQGMYFEEMMEGADGKLSIYAEEITDAFVEDCIAQKPDIVILSGDLTFNGEEVSHKTLASKLQKLLDNHIQPLVIPGNHDIANAFAMDYSTQEKESVAFINPEDFSSIYKDFGYEGALYKDEGSLSYVWEVSKDSWLLMLDTAKYEDNTWFSPEATGRIREEQFEWIESILKEAKEKNVQVISVTHHNVVQQTSNTTYTITNKNIYAKLCDTYDLEINLSGHIHAQSYRQREMENTVLTDIATSSLAVCPHQYGVITWIPNTSFSYDTQPIDMESFATKHKLEDPFFIYFKENDEEYFMRTSTARVIGVYEHEGIDAEHKKELIQTSEQINLHVFSGTLPEYAEELKKTELYFYILSLPQDVQNHVINGLSTFTYDTNHFSTTFK